MEVGLIENLERNNMLLRVNNSSLEGMGRLVLDELQAKATLDGKQGQNKASIENRQIMELGLYDNQSEDEGEIMLLAMILLQLHGVKLPLSSSEESESLSNKKKRQRTSPEQLAILEQIFQTDKMPNQQTRVQLADQLGMSSRRVQIWFQNKRAKVKRSSMKNERTPEGSQSPGGHIDSADVSPSVPTGERRNSTSSSAPSSPVPGDSPSSPALSPTALVPQLHKSSTITAPNTSKQGTFTPTQLQFSLASFESQPLLLPNEYTAMRLSMLKN
jgi:hypothetical protein